MELIAIGDSITEGFIDNGSHFHPFTTRLEHLLNFSHRDIFMPNIKTPEISFDVKISNFAQSGSKTLDIKKNLEIILQTTTKKFKFGTVLTGLNDLSDIHELPELEQIVLEDIKSICQTLKKHGCKFVFLMTMPVCYLDSKLIWYKELKSKMNNKIRQICNQDNRIILIDVAKKLSFFINNKIWDDLLHFNEKGYDLIADLIYEKIFFFALQQQTVTKKKIIKIF